MPDQPDQPENPQPSKRSWRKWAKENTQPLIGATVVAAGVMAGGLHMVRKNLREQEEAQRVPAAGAAKAITSAASLEGEKENFARITRARITAYFAGHVNGGEGHPFHQQFQDAVAADVSKMSADEKHDYYAALTEQWSGFMNNIGEHMALPEKHFVEQMLAEGKEDRTQQRRTAALDIQFRMGFLAEKAYRDELAKNPDAYFDTLKKWAATYDAALPKIMPQLRENAKTVALLGGITQEQIAAQVAKNMAELDEMEKLGMSGLIAKMRQQYDVGNSDGLRIAIGKFENYTKDISSPGNGADLRQGPIDARMDERGPLMLQAAYTATVIRRPIGLGAGRE